VARLVSVSRRQVLIVVPLMLLGAAAGLTQEAESPPYILPRSAVHTLPSEIVGDTFVVSFATPLGYMPGDGPLPVVVMTDADLAFAATAQIARLMQLRAEIPDFLLVGVGYGDLQTALVKRRRDLTPTSPSDRADCQRAPGCGGAERFLGFIQDELLPFIAARYEVSGDHTFVGNSLGGLFGAFSLINGPTTFRRYVLGSPSVSWDDRRLIRRAGTWRPALETGPSALFVGVGGEEGSVDDVRAFVRAVVRAVEDSGPGSPFVALSVFDGERHMSAQPMVVARGLRIVFEADPPRGAAVR